MECVQRAVFMFALGLHIPYVHIKQYLSIDHSQPKESRIPRITVTTFIKPKVMLIDNAERDICLSKHYFNPGNTRNDRYLSFIPSKHSIAWQTRNLFFCFCFCFCFPSVYKKLGNTISTFIQGNRPQTFPSVFILLEWTHCSVGE